MTRADGADEELFSRVLRTPEHLHSQRTHVVNVSVLATSSPRSELQPATMDPSTLDRLIAQTKQRFCPTDENDVPLPPICDPDPPPPRIVPPPGPPTDGWNDTVDRCAASACNQAFLNNEPVKWGALSPKSKAVSVFSYSEWSDGVLQKADCSLIRAIAKIIDTTNGGDTIRVAITAWHKEAWGILEALWNAHNRGVRIFIITGASNTDKWYSTDSWILSHLEVLSHAPSPGGGTRFRTWKSSPRYPNISHNKFVLVERKSAHQHIVMIGSANWRFFDIARNCDLLAVNNKVVHDAFAYYFSSLWDSLGDQDPAYNVLPQVVIDPQAGLSAHFFPILKADGTPDTGAPNPYVSILRQFRRERQTTIRVIGAAWPAPCKQWGDNGCVQYWPYSEEAKWANTLAQELVDHRRGGSDVRVIANHHKDPGCHSAGSCETTPFMGQWTPHCETHNEVWRKFDAAHIPWAKVGTHSKVLIVSGRLIDGGAFRQSVYSGTANMTLSKTLADAFIGVHDDPVTFSQYEAWWRWLCANAAWNWWKGSPFPTCAPPHDTEGG
ncbi:MAG: hypothetical protein H6711_14370 [Myxococcales bacterium]|nr:hypothetical protein [Myxococcales bacterium]